MDSQINTKSRKRGTLYAIGASTLLLALMAFSALCFGVIHVCHRWLTTAVLSFWEILGVSVASLFIFILYRSIRRRNLAVNDSISRRLREAAEVRCEASEARCAPVVEENRCASAEQRCAPTEGRATSWRDLYDQLSEEERKEMKAMMKKYCSGADPSADGECAPPASPRLP